MICLDSSALLAIVLNEPDAAVCLLAISEADDLIISAGTVAEALIVAGPRGVKPQLLILFGQLDLKIANVTWQSACGAADAHERWGKGRSPAKLNYGDCFAYELAMRMDCPLLFVGDDFSRTDIKRALQS